MVVYVGGTITRCLSSSIPNIYPKLESPHTPPYSQSHLKGDFHHHPRITRITLFHSRSPIAKWGRRRRWMQDGTGRILVDKEQGGRHREMFEGGTPSMLLGLTLSVNHIKFTYHLCGVNFPLSWFSYPIINSIKLPCYVSSSSPFRVALLFNHVHFVRKIPFHTLLIGSI